MLYHELAHIFHEHISDDKYTNAESRRREKEADLTAAALGDVEGGIYLFELMSNYDIETSQTHPSFQERAKYLREYQTLQERRVNEENIEPHQKNSK